MTTPPLKTGTVGLAADGGVWDLATSQKIGDANPVVSMDDPISVKTGDALDQGVWVVTTSNCSLIHSDGTDTSPVNGNAYLITVS